MNAKQELINYIKSLTPGQAEKVMKHYDFLKESVNMSDGEALLQSFQNSSHD